jgi:ectoine hydroxylase-related dioxygenase (phytanoyl-CoA dioxygenase family)
LVKTKPEAGKILMFDGSLYHASSKPIKNKIRKVVNINFKYA